MRYGVSHTKAGVNTADTPMWLIHPGTNDDVFVYEIGLSVAGTTAPTNGPMWRLVRSTAFGTISTQVTPVLEDPGSNTANAKLDVAWSVNPTVAAQSSFADLRRFQTTNAIGNGIVWTWYDKPLYIPASAGVCIVNGTAAGASLGTFNVYVRFDE
jgi:hypothetical protein